MLKVKLLLLAFFFLSFHSFAQKTILLPIQMGERWGIINNKSEIISPAIYDNVQIDEKTKLAFVENNMKVGVVDSTGKEIIPVEMDSIISFNDKIIGLIKADQINFCNILSKEISPSFLYRRYLMFSRYLITATCSSGTYLQNINTTKSVILPFDTILTPFIQYRNPTLLDFFVSDNLFVSRKGRFFGLVDENLKEILETKYTDIKQCGGNLLVEQIDEKGLRCYGLATMTGKFLLNPIYSLIEPYGNKLWKIHKDGKVGMIDSLSNKMVIPLIYDYVSQMDNGEFQIRNEGYTGIVASNGKLKIPPKYSAITVNGDFYTLEQNGRWGVADKNGNIILSPKYEFATVLQNQAICFLEKKKYGLANLSGKTIVQPVYDFMNAINNKFVEVGSVGRIGVLDYSGNIVVNTDFYSVVYEEKANLFSVCVGGSDIGVENYFNFYRDRFNKKWIPDKITWGVVNTHKEWLLETIFDRKQIFYTPEVSTVKAVTDTGAFVTTYDENGYKIEQNFYSNYSAINLVAKPDVRYVWKLDKKETNLWGLFTYFGSEVLEYQYREIQANYLGMPNYIKTTNKSSSGHTLVEAKTPEDLKKGLRTNTVYKRFGIVDDKIGKELLSNSYVYLDSTGFPQNNVLRAVTTRGSFFLFDSKLNRVGGSYNFVDEFSNGYARFNKGGELECLGGKLYSLNTPEYFRTPQKKCLECFRGNLHCTSGKWGVVDSMGSIVIKANYEFIQHYFNKIFLAKKNGKWGVLTAKNDSIIPFIYSEIQFLKDENKENAWLKADLLKVKLKNQCGIIDLNGKVVINIEYDDVKIFPQPSGNFYGVKKNGKWGVISPDFQQIVPFIWDEVSYLRPGISNVIYGYNRRYMYCFLDETGKQFTPFEFYSAGNFSNGYAIVSKKSLYSTFLDKNGKLITKDEFRYVHNFSEGYAAIYQNGKWGFLDTNGNIAIGAEYLSVGDFVNGLAPVAKMKKERKVEGYISPSNKLVVKARFDSCYTFKNGVGIVRKGKNYGAVNPLGKFIFDPKYDKIEIDSCIVIAYSGRNFAVKNLQGKELIKSGTYSKIGNVQEGVFAIQKGGKWGFMDINGTIIHQPIYRDVEPFSFGYAAFQDRSILWGFLSKTKIAKEPTYVSCRNFTGKYCKVVLDKRNVVIDRNFKIQPKAILKNELTIDDFTEGLAITKSTINRYYYIDTLGNRKFTNLFRSAKPFKNNLAIVQKEKYGIINTKGSWVVFPYLSHISPYSEGRAAVACSELFKLYDFTGKEITTDFGVNIKILTNDLYEVHEVNRFYYINSSGKIIWKSW